MVRAPSVTVIVVIGRTAQLAHANPETGVKRYAQLLKLFGLVFCAAVGLWEHAHKQFDDKFW